MNVASLELCRELYELSGWNRTEYLWVAPPMDDTDYGVKSRYELRQLNDAIYFEGKIYNSTFAYDLGYLLRKLPRTIKGNGKLKFHCNQTKQGLWAIGYAFSGIGATEYTLEDAAAKLCIELLKQGILTRG